MSIIGLHDIDLGSFEEKIGFCISTLLYKLKE